MDTIIELSAQWTNPSDVTTVLMVIGGDVVQKALAQCTGTLYVPVCFSFGWVSFAFVALVMSEYSVSFGRINVPICEGLVIIGNLDNRLCHWLLMFGNSTATMYSYKRSSLAKPESKREEKNDNQSILTRSVIFRQVNVLGDGRLLPAPDYPAKIFNLQSGYVRENKNWVIGRILRDHERSMWRTHGLHSSGVRITVFDAIDRPSPGKGLVSKILRPKGAVNRHPFPCGRTHLWDFLITLVQLGIAAIPIALDRDWGVMLVTAGGTLLALVFGAMPQWTVEKLPSRMRSRSVFALTSGNGSKDIMVVRGLGKCWDLEDFAALDSPRNARAWNTFNLLRAVLEAAAGRGSTFSSEAEEGGGARFGFRRATTKTATFGPRRSSFVKASRDFRGVPMGFAVTTVVCIAQSVLWLLLLITVAALKANTWYLVAVGGLGMFQNAVLAAMTRPPDRRGLFLKRVDEIVTRKVMDGLMDLEAEHGWGTPLVGEFFSGKLQPAEEAWWGGDRVEYDKMRRKDPTRGIPRSYLAKHRSLTSSVAPEPVPSGSPGPVEMTGATGAPTTTMSPMSPPTEEATVLPTEPIMASIPPIRTRQATRSVTFESVKQQRPMASRPGRSLASFNPPLPRSRSLRASTPVQPVDSEGSTKIDSATSDAGNYLSSSSTLGGDGHRQIIEISLEYLDEASNSERTTTGGRAKGKHKELPNPFDDLRPDPIWSTWNEEEEYM